jgi:hypothetical protein
LQLNVSSHQRNSKKAAGLFYEENMIKHAAECYMTIRNYKKASEMFEECDLILKALECLECMCDWEGILLCLHKNKDHFKEAEKEALINKYVPIALNSIYRSMVGEENAEENRGKLLEDKYMKNKIDRIDEEDSDIDSEESEEEKEPEGEGEKENEEEVKLEETIEEPKEEPMLQKQESEEEQISTLTKEKLEASSFSLISKGELDDNFEHLSNFDPEDEFLNSNKSFSVLGSVLFNDQKSIAEYSDYSIVSGSRISNIKNSNTIETNRDIYIEDKSMEKIIYYISLFSEETQNYLSKFRSKDKLMQKSQSDLNLDEFELEIDNLDEELLKIVLDVLESYDMFRLCMVVCNRYNVKENLSRYLTSVCYKYSNLKLLTYDTIIKVNDPLFRKKQKDVSVLANEAIHNMFSLVNPHMLEQAKTEDLDIDDKTKSITGIECWRYLFYLGFWKKLVFIMDSHSSLQLCYSIGDLENFKIIYMVHYRQDLNDNEVKQRLSSNFNYNYTLKLLVLTISIMFT